MHQVNSYRCCCLSFGIVLMQGMIGMLTWNASTSHEKSGFVKSGFVNSGCVFPWTSFLPSSSFENSLISKNQQNNQQDREIFLLTVDDRDHRHTREELSGFVSLGNSNHSSPKWMQDQESQTAAASSQDEENLIQQQMIEEINSIRQKLGGGMGEIFSGSAAEQNQYQSLFKRQLESILADQTQELPNKLSQNGETKPAAELTAENRVGVTRGLLDETQIAARRKAARLLEKAAAELEEVSLYVDADLLREKANQLWQSARNELESR